MNPAVKMLRPASVIILIGVTILMAAGCAAGPGTTGREGSFADIGETSAAPAITQTTPETGHGSSLTSTPTGKTATSESSIGDVSKEGAATGDSRPSDNVTRDTGLEDISPVIEPTPAHTPTPYPETVHSQNLEEIQALLPFKVILPRLPGVFTVPPWFSYAPPPGAVGGTFRTDYMVRGERRKISIDEFI